MEHCSTGEENGQNPELYDQDINDFVLQKLTVLERYAAQDTDHFVFWPVGWGFSNSV